MFPVGIDVSKNTLDLCMLYDGIKGRIKTRNIQNNRHSVENILRWLRLQHCGPEDVHVVMEATGVYHERLATELHDAGFYVSLANPHRSREFARGMGIMTKTDKVDAYMLACYAFLKNPHRWEPPAPEIRYLGALLRRRDVLLGDALREENRLEKYLSTDTPADIISSCMHMAQLLRDEVSNIERQIKAHIKASPALRRDYRGRFRLRAK
ncbi:transposase [Klebsiella pasteurii]|nr:transposase [Klebsiella pasteurii]